MCNKLKNCGIHVDVKILSNLKSTIIHLNKNILNKKYLILNK